MKPDRTFQVHPPATFIADQLPETGILEFQVPGSAGQVLHVTQGQGWQPYVSVQTPGSGDKLIPGGDNSGNWLYALPSTGTYRVVAQRMHDKDHPVAGKAVIQFALLTIDDPMLDPGIRPEQISVDFKPLAPQSGFELVPYSNFEGDEGDFWPSHLAALGSGFELRVMPVEGYRKILKDKSMSSLQTALRAGGSRGDARNFPYPVYGDAGLNISTRPTLLSGDGWQALRWIGQFAQDTVCGFDNLTYVAEGLSNDGRFFVMFRADIKNPGVNSRLMQKCEAGSKGRNFDAFFAKEISPAFDRELSAADPSSFQPNLDQLDAVMKSLKLKR